MTTLLDPRRRKLSFRAWHRGFKEADLILGRFADAHLAELDESELDAFEHLLEQPDQELYGWIIGRTETPSQFDSPLMARLQAFNPAKGDGA